MTHDYPNNIEGVSILCNIHFEDDLVLVLKDESFLNAFMIELTQKLNLIPIIETLTSKHFKEENPVGEGITGTMILKTSHCCYHTWSREKYMRFELSVCKVINAFEIVSFIYEYFGIRNLKFVTHETREW